jgi:hypothetical protein
VHTFGLDDETLLLTDLLSSVAVYQSTITAETSRVVRGGLARGQLHVSSQQIYGPALVDAVQLEEREAIFPRILISQGIYDALMLDLASVTHYRTKQAHPQEGSISEYAIIDGDGWAFINYLIEVENDVDHLLERHKTFIESSIERSRENARIRDKYIWMAVYHNLVIAKRHKKLQHLSIKLDKEWSPVARRQMRFMGG